MSHDHSDFRVRKVSKKYHYVPTPPSRHIPGVTTIPPVKSPAVRMASYDPDGPPCEIIQWWSDPVENDPANSKARFARLESFQSRLLSDYDFDGWLTWLPYWPDLSEADQLYRVADEDDDGESNAPRVPLPTSDEV